MLSDIKGVVFPGRTTARANGMTRFGDDYFPHLFPIQGGNHANGEVNKCIKELDLDTVLSIGKSTTKYITMNNADLTRTEW